MAAGMMPNLERLVAEGTAGTLETLHPPLSPLVWTTMMTGVDPVKHRILDFVRLNPASGQKEPITSDERQAPGDLEHGDVGRPEGWRVRPVGDVSRRTGQRPDGVGSTVHVPVQGVHAARGHRLSTGGRGVGAVGRAAGRIGGDVRGAQEVRAAPDRDRVRARPSRFRTPYSNPVSALRRTLIETRVYDDLASTWIQRARPDLAIVYFQGTDSIGHTFAPFAPPKQPTIDQADYDRYSGVPRTYFAEIDRLLGSYREVAEQRGGVLMLASDHGFAWAEGRPTQLSSNAQATAAKWHRNQGIYALWGKGIAAKGRDAADTGSVRQVCATLLAAAGLPPMKGEDAGPLPGSPGFSAGAVDYASHYHPVAPAMSAGATSTVDARHARAAARARLHRRRRIEHRLVAHASEDEDGRVWTTTRGCSSKRRAARPTRLPRSKTRSSSINISRRRCGT